MYILKVQWLHQELLRSIAACHGTVGVVSDPHEIANVIGMEGVDFMINDSKESSFVFLVRSAVVRAGHTV